MTSQQQIQKSSPNAPAILVIVCFSILFGVLNASAVGVVLPEIAADLGVETGQLSWLMTGFLLVYGIAIPFYGRLADLYGAKPLFILGVGIFSAGSILSAVSPNFELLLIARLIQAGGGAAVPGLGMTLASRAYGPEARGTVLGVLAATIGAGGAIGPLLGGALSEAWGWQSIFYTNAIAAAAIPFALRILPGDEHRSGGTLDIIGGISLSLIVVGVLLVPSEAAESGWTSSLVLLGLAMAVIGVVGLVFRQVTARSPFIPAEFLRNRQYLALVSMSFAVMAADLAVLIGLPILLVAFHGLSSLEVGLVMLPGAVTSSISGVLGGRLTDKYGPRLPVWTGAPIMLVAVIGLSIYSGSSTWTIAAAAGVLGLGFGLVNTPIAAVISQIVRGQMLASALSINSMLFFLGGSFGTAILIATSTARGSEQVGAINPLHTGMASGFSDGLLAMAVPMLIVMALSLTLPSKSKLAPAPRAIEPVADETSSWVPDCSVPWAPNCVEREEASPLASSERAPAASTAR